jgi:hypothetical protein
MHEFMPTRTRAELKKKFKKEEKLDMDRINEVGLTTSQYNLNLFQTLKKPSMLDEKLREKAKEMQEKVSKNIHY